MKYPKFWIYVIAAIMAAMIITSLCACNWEAENGTIKPISGTVFGVMEVDSCEYLIAARGYMAHKGNCKYCEQRRKR